MSLTADLERIAGVAAAHGAVEGVLAAEPADGMRCYVVALGGEERSWLVLRADGEPVTRREDVRDVASIVAMCELAADTADALGFDAGQPPRVATPGYLDSLGAVAIGQPEFTNALRGGTGAIDAFVKEVERGYAVPLG